MDNQFFNTSSIPSQVINISNNKVGVLDDYILYCTGEYRYSLLTKSRLPGQTAKLYTFSRSSSGGYNYYTVTFTDHVPFEYNVTNEYYVYSNIGYGQALKPVCYDGLQTFSLVGMTCALFLAIVFKGGLFKCLRRKKR